MPGSKRRALKKLLSPSSSPATHPTNPLSPTSSQSLHPTQSGDSISSNPGNYLTDDQLKEDLVIEEMVEREGRIGGGGGGGQRDDGVQELGYRGDVPPPNEVTAGVGGGTQGEAGDGGKKKKSSKQRFAEREARKREALLNSAPPDDPAWTAQLEKERQEEIRVISEACVALGREIHEIDPDGHCMYSAISDQLTLLSLLPQSSTYHTTRQIASEYMLANPDEFIPFLPSVGGEDSAGAMDDGIMSLKDFGVYCERVRGSGEWGGEPEIQALSKAFKVPIHVIQRGPPTVVSHGGLDDSFGGAMTPEQSASLGDRVIRITYHRRMYGLGEHYNSLRKIQ